MQNSQLINDDHLVADIFNKYFISVLNELSINSDKPNNVAYNLHASIFKRSIEVSSNFNNMYM